MMDFLTDEKKKKQFWCTYSVFIINGMLALSIGSLLPFIRDAKGLDYAFCGLIVSLHSVGNLVSSFISGALAAAIGRKKSILFFNAFIALSYILIIFGTNNLCIATAFFLTGIARGATSNFCNTAINELAPGRASILNGLHAMFAIGAFTFPLLLLAITTNNESNWIFACYFMLAMGILSWFLYFMIPNSEAAVQKEKKKINSNFGFFKEPLFYMCILTLFFYLCAEQGVIGWMITYFKDTGLLPASLSQVTASVLWVMMMVKGIRSYSLMVVPFFITMGCLMGSGGISEKLIALANACVGWMTGGLAMVNIVASYFFGGISGSAAADTASLGSILIPMMVDQGYDDDFSTAVTITSSCEGLLVPPSHNMVIYAMSAGGISIGSLFLAGYLPGALLAVSLMVGSYIISKKRNYPKGDKFSIIALFKQLLVSIWALAAVVIVVFGVVAGVFTATESAAIAVIYSLIVSVFVYKGLNWKGVWNVLEQCIDTLAIVLILISTSSIFGYCLTTLHVPDMAATGIIGITDNKIILAILLNIILLILGCIMDMAPIILIATPILLPIATSIGIDPIQFGIMMVLNCGIGLLTPPVGAVLFIGSAVGKVKMEKVVKATLPFYLCMIIVLMLITFIPAVTLFLPNLLG